MVKKKSDVRKIYKTSDGYFNSKPVIKKPRRVAVIDQRKDDGALAVVKIYSKKNKSGKAYIDRLVLRPANHSSLTEDSIVGSQVYIGVKQSDGSFKPIFNRDFITENDELTHREYHSIKKKVHSDTPEHRQTYRKKMKLWKKHFKK